MNLQAALKDTLILKLILYKGTINNWIVVWQLDKNSGIAWTWKNSILGKQ